MQIVLGVAGGQLGEVSNRAEEIPAIENRSGGREETLAQQRGIGVLPGTGFRLLDVVLDRPTAAAMASDESTSRALSKYAKPRLESRGQQPISRFQEREKIAAALPNSPVARCREPTRILPDEKDRRKDVFEVRGDTAGVLPDDNDFHVGVALPEDALDRSPKEVRVSAIRNDDRNDRRSSGLPPEAFHADPADDGAPSAPQDGAHEEVVRPPRDADSRPEAAILGARDPRIEGGDISPNDVESNSLQDLPLAGDFGADGPSFEREGPPLHVETTALTAKGDPREVDPAPYRFRPWLRQRDLDDLQQNQREPPAPTDPFRLQPGTGSASRGAAASTP